MKLSSIDSCLLLTVVSLTLLCSVHLYQRSVEQYTSYYRRKIVVDSETIQLTTESASLEANLVGNFYLSEPRKILMNLCHMDECSKHKAPRWRMIMFVKSSVGNTRQRELIRKTWGSLSHINGGRMDTVFVLGMPTNSKVQNLIRDEIERYSDILQYNGSDAYRDIPQKTLAGMQWASENLKDGDFYSSVDDDFQINMKEFQEAIDLYSNITAESDWPEFPIICGFVLGDREAPMRGNGIKWGVSKDEYRWPRYPPFCHGGFYTTSVRVIKQLYNESRSVALMRLDHVWITGILRRKLGMPDEMIVAPKAYYAVHHANPEKIIDNFKDLLNRLGTENTCRCFVDEIPET